MSGSLKSCSRSKTAWALITLNRPKALNALTHGMILELEKVIPEVGEGSCGQGGGAARRGRPRLLRRRRRHRPLREMRDNPTGTLRRDFFRDEYIVNRRIYRYAKPWISLIDGIDMGGGVGLSVHGSHSVASEKFLFAMPETTIGLFPRCRRRLFPVARLPGALGTFLALTSHRLKAADAVWAGIVDGHVPSCQDETTCRPPSGCRRSSSGPDADRKAARRDRALRRPSWQPTCRP